MSGLTLQALKNEVDTIRCYASLFRSDAQIVDELLLLREFRDQHPLPATARPASLARPKSALIRHAEALLIFGEYCEREARRLAEKLDALKAGSWEPEVAAENDAERARNEAIAQRAIAAEEDANAPVADARRGGA